MALTGKRMNEFLIEGADIPKEEQKDVTAIIKANTGQADANAFLVRVIFDLTNAMKELDKHSSELSQKMLKLTKLLFWATVIMTISALLTLWKMFNP